MMNNVCKFDRAWVGICGEPTIENSDFCEYHSKQKCWCGAQATHECEVASTFVCGARLCPEHDCCYVAHGWTGSEGVKHSERGFQQHEEWEREHNMGVQENEVQTAVSNHEK